MGKYVVHTRNNIVQVIDYKNGKRYVFSTEPTPNSDTIEIKTLKKLVQLEGESEVAEDTDVGVQDAPDDLYEFLDTEGYDVEDAHEYARQYRQ